MDGRRGGGKAAAPREGSALESVRRRTGFASPGWRTAKAGSTSRCASGRIPRTRPAPRPSGMSSCTSCRRCSSFACLSSRLSLKLVYFRSGRLYVEHLIFALHVQALAFLSFLVIRLGRLLGGVAGKRRREHRGDGPLSWGCSTSIFRAFRTVYGQGRLTTRVKLGLVLFAYGLILIFGHRGPRRPRPTWSPAAPSASGRRSRAARAATRPRKNRPSLAGGLSACSWPQ
jgi:hypothetical protein